MNILMTLDLGDTRKLIVLPERRDFFNSDTLRYMGYGALSVEFGEDPTKLKPSIISVKDEKHRWRSFLGSSIEEVFNPRKNRYDDYLCYKGHGTKHAQKMRPEQFWYEKEGKLLPVYTYDPHI